MEKDAVLAAIDSAVKNLNQVDYSEFLDWLGAEAECREMILNEESGD